MVIISGAYGKLKRWVKTQLHTDHQSASSESAEFKDVNIAANEGYKIASDIILKTKGENLFIGVSAGANITTGIRNTFLGYECGMTNENGNYNNFIGFGSGRVNTRGKYNNFMGYASGYGNITGERNNFMGNTAGYKNKAGHYNNFMGYQAGFTNNNGHYNTFVGNMAGKYNYDAGGSVCIGSAAGFYETAGNRLFIDNAERANAADARVKALIYGIFNAATANQLVRLNAILELTTIKNGSTQANAGAAINEVWKTNGHASLPDNVLIIGI